MLEPKRLLDEHKVDDAIKKSWEVLLRHLCKLGRRREPSQRTKYKSWLEEFERDKIIAPDSSQQILVWKHFRNIVEHPSDKTEDQITFVRTQAISMICGIDKFISIHPVKT